MEHKKIGARIESRRKELNLTLADVAVQVGVAASTIQRYEKGQFDKIKLPVIEAIASALHVSPEWLTCKTDDPIDYNDGDLLASIPDAYLDHFQGDVKRAISAHRAADLDARTESSRGSTLPSDAIPYKRGRRLPVLGSIPAGVPMLAVENIEDYQSADVPDDETYFYLRVRGDSMTDAGINTGDLVLIHMQSCAENGDIVVCMLNGDEATLKRFYQHDDVVVLQPANTAYQPIVVPLKEFRSGYARILGVATEVLRKLK